MRLRRLLRRRTLREVERKFVIEGGRGILSALNSQIEIEAVYFEQTDDALVGKVVSTASELGYRTYEVAKGTMERVTDTVTPQSVMAVANFVDQGLDQLPLGSFVVVMAGVRDPGNAGTIIRSALASGASALIMCHQSVDLYNPKTVRSSAGALFNVPISIVDSFGEVYDFLHSNNYRLIGTSSHSHSSCWDCDLSGRIAIVVGNEANGLESIWTEMMDSFVKIPIDDRAESLNVAVAASIVMFEASRQRQVG